MGTIEFYQGDNRDSLRRLIKDGVRVHSVITDPPYGLVSITKRFGKEGSAPAKFGSDGAFSRASAGFMGSKWDATGIERDPEFWALIYEILLPGGFVAAFSGARTGHWQACAMELAGFIMHPMLGWVYGQGFPKAHNAAMAIDKALGVQGGKAPSGDPVRRLRPGADQHKDGSWEKLDDRVYQPGTYMPSSPEAAAWSGWAYGAQTLKPALEPIFVGQKPFSEKNGALNLLRHGVGAFNIDGCRAGDRHPANLLHDGSEAVLACFPIAPGQLARSSSRERLATQNVYGEMARGGEVEKAPRGDSGSAARFFNAFQIGPDEWVAVPVCEPFFYHAKAGKDDRAGSKHPTVKPVALLRWLCRLLTPPGGTVLDPFAGSGTTGRAALDEGFSCVLMEAEDQFASDIRRRFNLPPALTTFEEDLLGFNATDSRGVPFEVEEDLIG